MPARCDDPYDLLIIGGGINGVGIARDAAGRGLKVLLCEKSDLASGTSSASSKLIHGGLRYLESYEFRLVRESLGERETLLRIAPHIIWPLRFVLPVMPGMRPRWMIRIGLFLYDHLARRSVLPGTVSLKLQTCRQGASLKPELTHGFEYSDCWADDARLVVLNAVDAAERGAAIATRTECVKLERNAQFWTATLRTEAGREREICSKILINAAGPWVEDVLGLAGKRTNESPNEGKVRLVKGSHLITRKLYDGDHAYIFQSSDGRVIFAIPYEGDFTLIGTTEEQWSPDQGPPKLSDSEARYLCEAVSSYFDKPLTEHDIISTFSGVRPLFDDKSAAASVVTRDYVFDLDTGGGEEAPLLSIFGGKLTTYRKLAEHALDRLAHFFDGMQGEWTSGVSLPGGDFLLGQRESVLSNYVSRYPWMPQSQLERMFQAYGTRLPRVIGGAACAADLGKDFGAGLYESEVEYLRRIEFARTVEDIVWRRSKLGLRMTPAHQAILASWLR
jgi:glycerol-3-phosphate dehydrogenase